MDNQYSYVDMKHTLPKLTSPPAPTPYSHVVFSPPNIYVSHTPLQYTVVAEGAWRL